MDAEKLELRRRIDTLDQYATSLHAALTGAEREIARLTAKLENVKLERDAAIAELGRDCEICKHYEACHFPVFCDECGDWCSDKYVCCTCEASDKWEWRGLCAENRGVKNDNQSRA